MSNKTSLYIGTAGWSYPDWRGLVYPQRRSQDFSELEYLSHFFNTVELNVTFYRIPPKQYVEKWSRTVREKNFLFCVKLGQQYTHTEHLPDKQDTLAFKASLQPLFENNQIGALLIQFPWRFKFSKTHLERLSRILDRFSEYHPAVEFRHKSWICKDTLQLLRDHNAAFVNIDQPVIGKSIEPSALTTSPVGYCRLHGRNYKNWFQEGAGRDARYDYLYNDQILSQWAKYIRSVADQCEQTFVVFNNHFRGQAAVNAFQMKAMLGDRKVKIPKELQQAFPQLKSITEPEPGETLSLF